MSVLQLLNRLRHRQQAASEGTARPFALTKLYFAGAAALLVIAGLTTALAAHGTADRHVNNTAGSSRPAESTAQALSPDTPEAADPQSTTDSSSESEGAANTNSHSVSVNADDSGTTVTVDGQTSTVPSGGSIDQTYTTDGDSPSNVHVSIDNSSQSSAGSLHSSHITVRSQTRSEGRSSGTATEDSR